RNRRSARERHEGQPPAGVGNRVADRMAARPSEKTNADRDRDAPGHHTDVLEPPHTHALYQRSNCSTSREQCRRRAYTRAPGTFPASDARKAPIRVFRCLESATNEVFFRKSTIVTVLPRPAFPGLVSQRVSLAQPRIRPIREWVSRHDDKRTTAG